MNFVYPTSEAYACLVQSVRGFMTLLHVPMDAKKVIQLDDVTPRPIEDLRVYRIECFQCLAMSQNYFLKDSCVWTP